MNVFIQTYFSRVIKILFIPYRNKYACFILFKFILPGVYFLKKYFSIKKRIWFLWVVNVILKSFP